MSAGAPNHPTAEPDFGHFRIERREDGTPWTLGTGAMGVTYKAWDEKLRLAVALKVITAAQVQNPQAQALFLREARAAARVRHTNVASVLALGDTPGKLHYAMEFVDGLSLAERLRQGAPLPPLLALDLALQAARGLEAIHEQKLVHRDLKPANLMLLAAPHPPHQEAWRVKIIDFGLARSVIGEAPTAADNALAPTIGFRGTTLYASPEQCEERTDLDGRSDLYALGCVLWEMLVGTPPFHARTHREVMNLHVHAPPPLQRLTHLPLSLQAIVARLLLKDRDERFADADALARALERASVKIENGDDVGEDPHAATLPQAEAAGRVASPTSQTAKPVIAASAPSLAPATSVPTAASPVPQAEAPRRSRGILIGVVGTFIAAALAFAYTKWGPDHTAPPAPAENATIEKSLAVLPFENASDAKDDAFFADGIMDDVLTTLAKIKDLKVINRASVMPYRGATGVDKMREIGRDLGVANVLEGRVRRSADRVVVNVTLTDVRTARQIWAERYDRTLADSLTLQGQLAQEIALALRATLSPAETRSLATKPTDSEEAYTLYLRAREVALRQIREPDKSLPAAIELLSRAIALDPKFALAHARLAEAKAAAYHFIQPSEELLQQARASAQEALRLRPGLGEAHYVLGLCHIYGARDYPAALQEYEKARQSLPGDAEVISAMAGVRRRQGRWREAIAGQEQARLLDPRNVAIADNLFNSYFLARDWAGAATVVKHLAALLPDGRAPFYFAQLDWASRADLSSTRALLAGATPPEFICPLAVLRYELALADRDFRKAEQVLRECPSEIVVPGSMPTSNAIPKSLLIGFAAKLAGDSARAQSELENAHASLEADAAKFPQNAPRQQSLALAYALLDRKDDALRTMRRFLELAPLAKDALDGADAEACAGVVYALVGEIDQSMDVIERSLVTPGGSLVSQLRLSPLYDALRSNPRFQKLLASPEPKTILR